MRNPHPTGVDPKPAKQPTERHMDDDAKSRMDDEGGSLVPGVETPAALKQADGG